MAPPASAPPPTHTLTHTQLLPETTSLQLTVRNTGGCSLVNCLTGKLVHQVCLSESDAAMRTIRAVEGDALLTDGYICSMNLRRVTQTHSNQAASTCTDSLSALDLRMLLCPAYIDFKCCQPGSRCWH